MGMVTKEINSEQRHLFATNSDGQDQVIRN